jgi:hypothetical protein
MSETATWSPNASPAAAETDALKTAVVMRLKALKINQALGSRAGMAENYGRLATLYGLRGHCWKTFKKFDNPMPRPHPHMRINDCFRAGRSVRPRPFFQIAYPRI